MGFWCEESRTGGATVTRRLPPGGTSGCIVAVPPTSRPTPRLRWRWLVPVVALIVTFHFSPFSVTLDRAFYDLASAWLPRPPPPTERSAIVLIDEATMAEMDKLEFGLRWPYPRLVFAGLIAALDRAGATGIVMDFTFFENSAQAEQDLILEATAAVVPSVVLGRTTQKDTVFWTAQFRSNQPGLFQRPRTGYTDFLADNDGVSRRYRAPGSLAAVAFSPPKTAIGGLLRWHGSVADLKAGDHVHVLSAAKFMVRGIEIINRVAEKSPEYTPEQITRALRDEAQLTGDGFDAVRGRTVFVGASASGTFDLKSTPVGKTEPGTLVHWTAWANLAGDGFIAELSRSLALALAALASLGLVGVGRWRPGVTAPGLAAIGFIAVLLGTAYAGMSAGWFLPPATPAAAVMLTLLGVTVESFWTEQRRKREIQAMFGSYVDPGVVALLVRDPNAIRLGGERREATVYFSDLAGFTDLSEKIPAEELMEIINLYLQEMSDCLIGYGAYIDKYIGDAVMAVFGAPQATTDHALAACRGALAARRVLAVINERLMRTHGRSLGMRIGINTGEMIVGNLGSERKRNYTVLGDAVNLASRLEGANKEFGTDIMIGENTARAIAGQLATRPLTRLRVKGKLDAIEVHELIGVPAELSAEQQAFLAAYCDGYARYAARDFAVAAAALARAQPLRPGDELTAELLRSAREFAHHPPPADWQPIVTLTKK